MSSDIVKFNERVANTIEDIQKTLAVANVAIGKLEIMAEQQAQDRSLLLEVMKDANKHREQQELRHQKSMELIRKEMAEHKAEVATEIKVVEEQQKSFALKMSWLAGVAAAVTFLFMVFKDPIVDKITNEPQKKEQTKNGSG